jgi:S-(hydroxymethyl)glutathione dehydrogenase/alcohol dehydrogenase
VPKALPLREAALLGCAVQTGAGMVRNTANLQAGQSIAVFGAGGIGLSAIMAAASAGAALIAAIDVTAQNCPARATPARLQRSTPGPKTRLPPSTP